MGWLIEDYPEGRLCPWCHRDFTIGRKRFMRMNVAWQPAVNFCPFCGHDLDASDEDVAGQGYEKAPARP